MTTTPPDADSIDDGDALSHEHVCSQPTTLTDGYGRASQVAVHPFIIEHVVMVEHANVGPKHGVRAYTYILRCDHPTVGVEVAALAEGHAGTLANLQTAAVINVRAAPELHDPTVGDDQSDPASEVDGLAAMRQAQPAPKPRLRNRDACCVRGPFNQFAYLHLSTPSRYSPRSIAAFSWMS